MEPDASSVDGRLLVFQMTPPSVLYLPTTDQVSSANKLSGFSGLMAMVCSAWSWVALLMLMFGPTVNGAAAVLKAKASAAAAKNNILQARLIVGRGFTVRHRCRPGYRFAALEPVRT